MLNLEQILEATQGKHINGNLEYIVKNYILDSRNVTKDDFFVPIVGNKNNAHSYIINCVENGICGYFIEATEKYKDEIIKKSKFINKDICIIEVANSQDALYEIGKYNRNLHMNIPVIAITGSVGKTSTREMIVSILSKEYDLLSTYKNYNGYIGLSLMLLRLENQELAVLEMGIDWVGEMDKLADAVRPQVAVITMIGTAHIGIIGSQENIFKEKVKIAKNMNKECTLILNGDDKYLKEYNNDNINLIKYNIKDAKKIETNEFTTLFETDIYNNEIKIKLNQIGEHNIYNVLSSIKVAEIYNIKTENIKKGIEEYKNLSGRFEKNTLKNGIKLIDDTYNASIDSMKSGMQSIGIMKAKRKIVVLGDMLELGIYSDKLHNEVGNIFKDIHVDILLTLGENSKIIAKEASKYLCNVKTFEKKDDLINEIYKTLKKDDLIYFKASNAMKFGNMISEIKEFYNKK
ncbi:MAG: UDP-N-acetylmuramoylalanyl-D-glutamyl-2,6-diaminopimelate/D-alanyl-D-alanyl ligase [Clostridia bacterium]|jgi:UDP-N-acetylmuramoyl-tripeptide--D-alanyl-D-alanine ligase|nr:UDP-N-acetylmuramoylalanyl-D-glutamyl-2,6-diaminopimelate/D-alanyl-D-alanyl ligase [Clostridia bacterium]